MSDKESYKQIFKSTSIFGGSQLFTIISGIIRSKFTAIILGPSGLGLIGLLSSITELIAGVTNFGLRTIFIKRISFYNANGDETTLAEDVSLLKLLTKFSGVLGMLIMLLFSKTLSIYTFGNDKYSLHICFLSIIMFVNQLYIEKEIILQSLRKINSLSYASIFNSVLNVICIVPLYYFFKEKVIVAVLILTPMLSYFTISFFSKNIKFNIVTVNLKNKIGSCANILKSGAIISISGLFTIISANFLRVYINKEGNLTDVGLYNAGNAILTTYVGLIFTAMSADYFPRLSSNSNNKELVNSTINQQGEIALMIIGPILTVFVLFNNIVINVLYSEKFLNVTPMLEWSSIGMYFKTASWTISYIFLAKSDLKSFFINELIINVIGIILNIYLFNQYGIEGLGISFLLTYFIYFFQVYYYAKIKYSYSINSNFLSQFIIQTIIGLLTFLIVRNVFFNYKYLLGIIAVFSAMFYSIYRLNNIYELTAVLTKMKNKMFNER